MWVVNDCPCICISICYNLAPIVLPWVIESRKIRIGGRFAVTLHRTLRIPDDGRLYPLPPGLGAFPLFPVDDYAERLPPLWREKSGVFIPLCQREALWLSFQATSWKPNAVKIAAGGINAVSGETRGEGLRGDPQNYLVCPAQPWLDGFNTASGVIRQFVAMPLGGGYTVEASLTGEEKLGGIQMTVFEPKPGRFPDQPPPEIESKRPAPAASFVPQSMGLGAGGRMKQKIYPDPYGLDVWDAANSQTVFIHILNSEQFHRVTGEDPPPSPISVETYVKYHLPWFDLYDESRGDVNASERLARAKTVAERDQELGEFETEESSPVSESDVIKVHRDVPGEGALARNVTVQEE